MDLQGATGDPRTSSIQSGLAYSGSCRSQTRLVHCAAQPRSTASATGLRRPRPSLLRRRRGSGLRSATVVPEPRTHRPRGSHCLLGTVRYFLVPVATLRFPGSERQASPAFYHPLPPWTKLRHASLTIRFLSPRLILCLLALT